MELGGKFLGPFLEVVVSNTRKESSGQYNVKYRIWRKLGPIFFLFFARFRSEMAMSDYFQGFSIKSILRSHNWL